MKLVVLGASGGVGRHVVSHGLARAHDIVALVRPSAAIEAQPGLRVVRADLSSNEPLEDAMSGCDAVVCCLGIRRANPRNPWSAMLSPRDFVTRTTERLASAMARHGVRRLVTISAAGVGDSGAKMNPLLRLLFACSNVGVAYRDLEQMESRLAATELDWIAVRPVTLTDHERPQQVGVVSHYGLAATISRRAVAEWMIERAVQPEPFRERTPMIASCRPWPRRIALLAPVSGRAK